MARELPSPSERRRRILESKQAWKERNHDYYAKQHAIIKARPEYRAKDKERYKRNQLERVERIGVPVRPVGRPKLHTTAEELEARRLRINARHQAWRNRRSESALLAHTPLDGGGAELEPTARPSDQATFSLPT